MNISNLIARPAKDKKLLIENAMREEYKGRLKQGRLKQGRLKQGRLKQGRLEHVGVVGLGLGFGHQRVVLLGLHPQHRTPLVTQE
jgi:hypothetical protein